MAENMTETIKILIPVIRELFRQILPYVGGGFAVFALFDLLSFGIFGAFSLLNIKK